VQQLFEFTNNHLILVGVFVVTLGVIVFTEFTRMTSAASSLTPLAATQLLNTSDAVFVDIRSDAEFRQGHVIDARHIPLASLDGRIQELEKLKSRDVIIYCERGMRSASAMRTLKKHGFEKIHNLAGGLAAWQKASLPVVT